MGKHFFLALLTVLIIGCSGGAEDDDHEDGRTSATPAAPSASNHSSVAPGTCNTCHNGAAATGKSSSHIATAASCDTCHRTTGWIPVNASVSGIPTIDFPVEAVFNSLASNPSTFNASATDAAGNGYFKTIEFIPGQEKNNPLIYATLLKTYSQTNTVKKNGVIAATRIFEDFYSTPPFYLFGNLNNMHGSSNYMKVATHFPLPTTGRVGLSGVLYNGKNYTNSSTLPGDTWRATWSLEADSATTAWLCLSTEITPANDPAGSTAEIDCFRINQAGDISGFKADVIENGIALSYR